MEKLNYLKQAKIERNLKNRLKNIVQLNLYQSLDSTNNKAKRYLKELDKAYCRKQKLTIFAADYQTKGRGRRGKNWFSGGPVGLAVTFLSIIENDVDKIPQITAAASLAVKDTFNFFELESVIKWPNDILVNNKKICGILSELVLNKKENDFVLIGCGINLNNIQFNPEIKNKTTSYYLEKGKKVDKNLFLAKLIELMEFYIKKYSCGSRKEIINKWKDELNLIGKKIDLSYKNIDYTVIILDILTSGKLLVKTKNDQIKEMDSLNTTLYYESLFKYNSNELN